MSPVVQRVSVVTRADIPTCTLDETIGEVKARTNLAGWNECVVVDCGDVVIGRLRNDSWNSADSATAEQVMKLGPTTVRPDDLLEPLIERMAKRGTYLVLVTTPQGSLVGAAPRDDTEHLLSGAPPEEISY